MLAVASNWRPGTEDLTVAQIMGRPVTAHYVTGWEGKNFDVTVD